MMTRYGYNTYLLTVEDTANPIRLEEVTEAAAIARARRAAVKLDASVDVWFRRVEPRDNEAYVGTASPYGGGRFSRNDLRA